MNFRKAFTIDPGSRVRLADVDPSSTGSYAKKEDAEKELRDALARLADLQYLLYAENRRAVLIILQAMDAGGKDGTIRRVFGALNPQGVNVHAFKEPTREQLAHDFLWRAHAVTPRFGQLGIFNRSQYEDVLVVRVHDLVPKDVWSKRYDSIVAFEKNLSQSGTVILKFFLHISPEEQLRRFEQRLDDPNRQWKISESDYSERVYWDDYQRAYEDALSKTSTERAPWFVIPADHKWFRNLAVARIVTDTLESMDLKTPPPSVDLDDIRRKYHEATGGTVNVDRRSRTATS